MGGVTMRSAMRTLATAAALAALALAPAVAVRAGDGNAVIRSVDQERGVVVLDTRSFRVTDRTVLRDRDGNATTLGQLPSTSRGADDDAAAVYYEASDAERGAVLHRLELVGSVPR